MSIDKYHIQDISKSRVLITGGCGFIGSHIVEYFADNGAGLIRVLDNLSTGCKKNIEHLLSKPNVEFIQGDITSVDDCNKACEGIDYISHQAALGSVPRSINEPSTSTSVNVNGFVNILHAAVINRVKKVVYASSSSVYGDHPALPKKEENTGNLMSPYAATKAANEIFAEVFAKVYSLPIVGLRYFNVFGERQNPNGPYAAVVPLFINAFLGKGDLEVHGDGTQTRDFTYVQNVVQANVKALFTPIEGHNVMNIACGDSVSLNEIIETLRDTLNKPDIVVHHLPTRKGDIKNSLADFSKAQKLIGYMPKVFFREGLLKTYSWFEDTVI